MLGVNAAFLVINALILLFYANMNWDRPMSGLVVVIGAASLVVAVLNMLVTPE